MSEVCEPSKTNKQINTKKQSLNKTKNRKAFKSVTTDILIKLSANQSDYVQQQPQQSQSQSQPQPSTSSAQSILQPIPPQTNNSANKVKRVAKVKTKTSVKRSKSVTQSQQINTKSMVSVDIQCDIRHNFDDSSALNELRFADLSDSYAQLLYDEMLRQRREQQTVLMQLNQQLNSEMAKLEMAKTNAANVANDYERKIGETKRSNWCANCGQQIRETDCYLKCCYAAIYCCRQCQLIDWRNGHQTNCTNK